MHRLSRNANGDNSRLSRPARRGWLDDPHRRTEPDEFAAELVGRACRFRSEVLAWDADLVGGWDQ